MVSLTACLTIAALLALTATAVAAPPARATDPADADFAADLYRHAVAGRKGNAFLSPAGVRATLALAAAGAAGRTAEQLAAALRLPTGAALPAAVDAGPDVTLEMANAVWVQTGLALRPAFTTRLATAGAEPHPADFRAHPDAARSAVNAWAAEHTGGKIADLLPAGSVTPTTRLVLANAVYLKADWATPFATGSTRPGPFHFDPKQAADVPMMHLAPQPVALSRTDAADVFELPYRGDRLAMLVVVPKAVDGLAAVERALTGDVVRGWAAALAPARATVAMPKFTARAGYDLVGPLTAMGMADAFDVARADFSAMADGERFSIGGVFHKTFVAVDEQGTEAAAATGLTMRATAVRVQQPPVPLVVDRPFLYLIRDRQTGSVLFIGRCVDPR